MKNINDLTENDAIECHTPEEVNKTIDLNPYNTCVIDLNNAEFPVYYSPKQCKNSGSWCYGDTNLVHKSNNIKNLTIHQAKDFLKPKFEYGEEVEVYLNNKLTGLGLYIGKNSKGVHVVEDKNTNEVYVFKHIRKIDHKRNEAI